MSPKNKKHWRKNRKTEETAFLGFSDGSILASEKKKARELRNSPWWKKKISKGLCYYCGKKFNQSDLTMDHKIPISRGGRSEKINLVPACKECNNKKMYLLPYEWAEYMNKIKESQEY